jgi:hypothetical protein
MKRRQTFWLQYRHENSDPRDMDAYGRNVLKRILRIKGKKKSKAISVTGREDP